jgi:outer membrane receptor for ferric coprogen and ferric-rhodotorulic acid
MTEAIRNVSGVTKYYGTLNDYSLIIRGMDATYSVFRNGVGGYWWNQQEDVAMLEKIEFIKGPASFIVSLCEPGGIVNNVTKQPTKERIASVSGGFGSFNLMRLTADLRCSHKIRKMTFNAVEKQERAFNSVKRRSILSVPFQSMNLQKDSIRQCNYIWKDFRKMMVCPVWMVKCLCYPGTLP